MYKFTPDPLVRPALSFAIAVAMLLLSAAPDARARGLESTAALPGAAAPLAPSGSIGTDYNPTYTWTKVADATWYYLWVGGPSGNVIKQWYNASLVCGVSTCSASPARTLAGGSYTWYIQTWNDSGYGPWSLGLPFSLTPLGAAVPVSPNGAITDNTPSYTWTEVPGATYYYVFVNGPGGNVLKKWYTDADASCSGGTCSVTPTSGLGGGDHTWWARTWNGGGYGPWSTGMSFSLPVPRKPVAATLIAPNGSISDTTPDYSWNEVVTGADGDAATWYYLWVSDPTGAVIKQWYEASVICTGGTCSVTPAIAVTPGSSTWWVQTWNNAGHGPWSSGMTFSIPGGGCHPSYPGLCIPPPPPDLNCEDVPYINFVVLPPDPHNFDGDHDGLGCET